MARGKLVAGNWKMHGLAPDLSEIRAIAEGVEPYGDVDVALCLPATLVDRAARLVPGFAVGGQDVHAEAKGAHTGDIAAAMLADAGAVLTIVGHSERRADHHESDQTVRAKASAALAAGLYVILCVGESQDVREGGDAISVVARQLAASLPQWPGDARRLAIAYEPIWAIGTGLVPSLDDIGAMHAALRDQLAASFGEEGASLRILYGGSVKASNAGEILELADVDGALVGGASLKAEDFLPIVAAASND